MDLAFDIKQFFRFVVSGYIFILYYLVILLLLSDALSKLSSSSMVHDVFSFVSTLFAAGLALTVPIGFLIHEIDVSILNAWWRIRRILSDRERLPLQTIRTFFRETERRDVERQYLQALLEFAKYSDKGMKPWDGIVISEKHKDSDHVNARNAHLDKEISNRYSYFYARIEAGGYAQVFAWVLFVATVKWAKIDYVALTLFEQAILVTLVVAFFAALSVYCLRLMHEIDALETLIVLDRREDILRLIGLLRNAGLIRARAVWGADG